MAAAADPVVDDLVNALGPGRKEPWKARAPRRPKSANGKITMEQIASALRASFNDPENVTFSTLGRGWPIDLWPLQDPMSYLGKDGGGGIGSGPGLSVGAALALHTRGRYAVSMLGDGDFCMGANALWTAVRHRIPMLVLVNNNRSYLNDELHQDTVARVRGREAANRWIGQRLEDPTPDIAKLAEAQGAIGIGPVRAPGDVQPAIEKGVSTLKNGGVCVIDFHVDPDEERLAGSGLGHRATGG
jgi:thiamine pyrophosphate-dependent acetolactate synthase large subunit-like protein